MNHNNNFLPISPEEEAIGKAIVNAAYIVHKELGPGLLEKVYEICSVMFYQEMDIMSNDN